MTFTILLTTIGFGWDSNMKQHKTLEQIYQEAFDKCAGPKQFRHACNYPIYHDAGLHAVAEAAIKQYAIDMEKSWAILKRH